MASLDEREPDAMSRSRVYLDDAVSPAGVFLEAHAGAAEGFDCVVEIGDPQAEGCHAFAVSGERYGKSRVRGWRDEGDAGAADYEGAAGHSRTRAQAFGRTGG